MEEEEMMIWRFQGNKELLKTEGFTVRGVLNVLATNLDKNDSRGVIPLGHGDPSAFPCFRTTTVAEDAVVLALRSANFNHYSPTHGLLTARRAVADYLNRDLPNKISADDVFLTNGCIQAIEIILSALNHPGANILLPRPGFPYYESLAARIHLQVRHFDLLPQNNWEVDLHSLKALADDNTVAMVIINPGNPCGSVYTHQHLHNIAEAARDLGILVIADEVYQHLAFGTNPYVPMGTFGSIVPVVTLGSISKRWVVPGWRLGWLVTNDPSGILRDNGIVDCIISFLDVSCDPVTFMQAALPHILERTKEDFFSKIVDILKIDADLCYHKIEEIPGLTCPNKPEGGMFCMVKLDISMFDGIKDDMEFAIRLVKEESVIVLPGVAVGMKNWLRITFAVEPSTLEEGFKRVKAFCLRHAVKQ